MGITLSPKLDDGVVVVESSCVLFLGLVSSDGLGLRRSWMLEAREAGRLMDSAGASDPFAWDSETKESSRDGDEVV